MKKLNATVEPLAPGEWVVTVTIVDTGSVVITTITAETEKEAAFKAMDQVNEQ